MTGRASMSRGWRTVAEGRPARFISQLTGVRFVAATWVMLYHYQGALATAGILIPVVHELLRVGRLGVDLFFALSGFILTHAYWPRLKDLLKAQGYIAFLRTRLIQIGRAHV